MALNGSQAVGKSCGGWTTKLHAVAASDQCAVVFSLSPGQAGDAPEGRKLLTALGKASEPCAMIMDKGDETRKLVSELVFSPVVPPKSSHTEPWEHDKELYKKRNEVDRLFGRLKGFRRIFTLFDKLDVLFIGFVVFALIVIEVVG